jgi:hypothetical protein
MRRHNNNNWLAGIFASAALVSGAAHAAPVTIVSENFEGYTSFPTQNPLFDYVNSGIPKISEGASAIWYGGRFETPDSGSIDSDLAVQQYGGGSNPTHTGRFEDDAGLLLRLDTTGMSNIQLSFDWRTFLVGTSDRLVVGYHVGSISQFGTCTGQGESGCFADLRTALPFYTNQNDLNPTPTGNWTQLLRASYSNAWTSQSYTLAPTVENQSEVWLAFWLDNGEGDYGKIDNVMVTATVVPVPAAVWLFGSGLLGLAAFARRKRRPK